MYNEKFQPEITKLIEIAKNKGSLNEEEIILRLLFLWLEMFLPSCLIKC